MASYCPPPRYVNAPTDMVYDARLTPAVCHTGIQLIGLAWESRGRVIEEIEISKLEEVTGKSRSTVYGHLAALRDAGWLQFSSSRRGGLTIRFIEPDLAQDSGCVQNSGQSENLDALNQEVIKEYESVNLLASCNESVGGRCVQKSGLVSENLDGRKPVLDPELCKALLDLGVFPEALPKAAELAARNAWSMEHLWMLIKELKARPETEGRGGLVLYRLEKNQRPLTPREAKAKEQEKYMRGYLQLAAREA